MYTSRLHFISFYTLLPNINRTHHAFLHSISTHNFSVVFDTDTNRLFGYTCVVEIVCVYVCVYVCVCVREIKREREREREGGTERRIETDR